MTGHPSRRLMLGTVGTLAGIGALAVAGQLGPSPAVAAPPVAAPPATAPWYELGLMPDSVMENQLLHFLSGTYSGQSDIGEVLATARRIVGDRPWSWPEEWTRTADRVRVAAEGSARGGHRISAGKGYLRAANYYRAALIHHPRPGHPSVLSTGRRAVAAYDRALELLALPARAVRIPYAGTTLPGYFFRSPRARTEAPLLIMHQGRDAWPEESKYVIDDALERGYHCLIFHGPGQGMAIRGQGLTFRPDWEQVITPVVDFAVAIPGVDADRIALLGISMGGALAPRAAAFERRLKILIANPGVLDWGQAMTAQFRAGVPEAMALLPANPAAFDAAMAKVMATVPLYDWYLRDSMNKHGVRTPSQLITDLARYTNVRVAEKITCRTLVMDGTGEAFSVGQAKLLHDALRCPKDYLLFTAEDTGLLHVQEGAYAVANQRMYDWLDEYL